MQRSSQEVSLITIGKYVFIFFAILLVIAPLSRLIVSPLLSVLFLALSIACLFAILEKIFFKRSS